MTAYLAGLVLLRAETDTRAADLDGVALLVLAAMASFATETAIPECYAAQSSIARRARVSLRTLRRELARLTKLGLIAHGGRRGKTVRWLLLFLSATLADKSGSHNPATVADKNPANLADKKAANLADKAAEVPSTAEQQPRARATEQIVLDATDATADEAAAVVKLIISKRQSHSPVGLIRTIADAGELPDWLEQVRADGKRAAQADAERTGWPCHRCRTRNRADATRCRQCHEQRTTT